MTKSKSKETAAKPVKKATNKPESSTSKVDAQPSICDDFMTWKQPRQNKYVQDRLKGVKSEMDQIMQLILCMGEGTRRNKSKTATLKKRDFIQESKCFYDELKQKLPSEDDSKGDQHPAFEFLRNGLFQSPTDEEEEVLRNCTSVILDSSNGDQSVVDGDADCDARLEGIVKYIREPLERIQACIQDADERLDQVIKDAEEDINIFHQSFSSIKLKDLPRMNIRSLPEISSSSVCSIIIQDIARFTYSFTIDWKIILGLSHSRIMTLLKNFYNLMSEASSRLIINDFLFHIVAQNVVKIYNEKSKPKSSPPLLIMDDQTPGDHGVPALVRCFPELTIGTKASSSSVGTAVEIFNPETKKVTKLTGYADFVGCLLLKDSKGVITWKGNTTMWHEDLLQQLSREMRNGVREPSITYNGWAEDSGISHWDPLWSSHMLVVEAKAPLVRLQDHIPQVVGEALAMGIKAKSSITPFCLASGLEWILGVVKHYSSESRTEYWVTSSIYLHPNEEGILMFIVLLAAWIQTPLDDLWKLGGSEV